MRAILSLIEQTLCQHRDIYKVDGKVLYVACMKCGKPSNGIVTGE